MDKDLNYHKVSDEVNTLDPYTISETIKAIAAGTKSIIDGKDTQEKISVNKAVGCWTKWNKFFSEASFSSCSFKLK